MADLRQLVSNAKKGDRDAFSSLYETVYTDLYRFALYCLNNPSDAEDAVSETVLDAWQELPHLRRPGSFMQDKTPVIHRSLLFGIIYA